MAERMQEALERGLWTTRSNSAAASLRGLIESRQPEPAGDVE
jgi:hypothetical protein